MIVTNTPIDDYTEDWGLLVKREDLSCPPPGPPFSKTRGVFKHIQARPEPVIGVLDTYHSQAGHAVAHACQLLGKKCINFFPRYKGRGELRPPQLRSHELGAELFGLQAGRSAVLYHQAKKELRLMQGDMGYLMPNALKLPETVEETAKEVGTLDDIDTVIIPSSSGTIAAGVIRGFLDREEYRVMPGFVIHLGYSRSERAVRDYIYEMVARNTYDDDDVVVIDEGYAYKDVARKGPTPPWPCNEYYDLKALRWWDKFRRGDMGDTAGGRTLLWNIG